MTSSERIEAGDLPLLSHVAIVSALLADAMTGTSDQFTPAECARLSADLVIRGRTDDGIPRAQFAEAIGQHSAGRVLAAYLFALDALDASPRRGGEVGDAAPEVTP